MLTYSLPSRQFVSHNRKFATLLKSWRPAPRLCVELHRTANIVNDPDLASVYLVNPANESLSGTQLSYFPIGGPCPELPPPGVSNNWGGMEAGSNHLYPIQTVDGQVAYEGGSELRSACAALPIVQAENVRCPTGSATLTKAYGSLLKNYQFIIHAVAPFRSDEQWESVLSNTYANTFNQLLHTHVQHDDVSDRAHTVAIPLLGSGARGGGCDECASVAAKAVIELACSKGYQLEEGTTDHEINANGHELTLRFAVIEKTAEKVLLTAFDKFKNLEVRDLTLGRSSPPHRGC